MNFGDEGYTNEEGPRGEHHVSIRTRSRTASTSRSSRRESFEYDAEDRTGKENEEAEDKEMIATHKISMICLVLVKRAWMRSYLLHIIKWK